MKIMWLNTGNHYKCYDDTDGRVLGRLSLDREFEIKIETAIEESKNK